MTISGIKYCKIIFSICLPLFLVQCNLLQQRAEEKKNTSRFNKRLLFTQKAPDSCAEELRLEFFRQQGKVVVEAESGGCIILFQWQDSQSETVITEWVLLGNKNTFSWQGRELLREADVGWGYRISGSMVIDSNSYPFQMFISKELRKQYFSF